MTRKVILERTINSLKKLPDQKIDEIADFIDFVLKKHEEEQIKRGIQTLISTSKSFEYLQNEEDIYTLNDIKVKYK
jgi:hypothetical protein